jgi:hypothetical protein
VIPIRSAPGALSLALVVTGCDYVDTRYTYVTLDNDYPASAATPLTVYRAYWQAVAFTTPVSPGTSSGPQSTVPCSANTAWVVLAPGWDATSTVNPTTFVVLQSRQEFGVNYGDTVDIPVSDATFAGNCASGSFLSQDQADFITQFVFPSVFCGLRYDAATCTTSPSGDAGECADAGPE